MLPSVTDYLNSMRKFKEKNLNTGARAIYDCYSMHDCKMLYLLTQHSLWNRKNFPFLLCNCKRGEGIVDPNHVCSIRSHESDISLWEKSEKQWERKQNKLKEGESYSCKDHMDWIDVNNEGISHFGIHPELFPWNEITFDTFHLKCSVSRRLMEELRTLLLEQSTVIQNNFCVKVLSKF